MLRRSGRLAVLTAVAAVSTAVFCGVAQADDDDDDSYGSGGGVSNSDGSRDGVSNSDGSRDKDDNSYRDRGGLGGEPGEKSAECGMPTGPGEATEQCVTRPPQRGADGFDRIVF